MKPLLAVLLIIALAACTAEKAGTTAGGTSQPWNPNATTGGGVTVPGSALSAMPVSGQGGPMQGSAGLNVPAPSQAVVNQTGSQAIGTGPAEYRRGTPADVVQ
ncbi:MAG: hypothetical protein JO212_19955 [Acetobacteraceae bacterium]|nr:hypothetical protein [Acetobacteraceae bacterium]